MLKIIDKPSIDIINVELAIAKLENNPDGLICYISVGINPTIAILKDNGRYYGFQYMNRLLRGRVDSLKFEGTTPEESVSKVIKAERNIYYLESTHDLFDLIKEI